MYVYVGMKKGLLLLLGLLWTLLCFSQEGILKEPIQDSLYREDQFYIGVTYNLLLNRPESLDQSDFSGGIHMGFIRDMPINKRRNLAIGLGIGYSFNVYNHSLFIGEEEQTEESVFLNLKGVNFSANKITTHLIEAPLELRWRTSIPDTHKFYRVYSGIRLGYLYHFKSSFNGEGITVKQTAVNELTRFRLGATFTFGWNTFNFHFYYSLNSLFDDKAILEEDEIGLNPMKVGLFFYLL